VVPTPLAPVNWDEVGDAPAPPKPSRSSREQKDLFD